MDQALKDEEVLRQLGYKQVLHRTWGTFTTITIAISAMSVLTSVTGALKLLLLHAAAAWLALMYQSAFMRQYAASRAFQQWYNVMHASIN